MRAFILSLALLSWTSVLPAQGELRGKVVDSGGEPVFAANVYLAAHPSAGALTNPQGIFVLSIADQQAGDTVIVRYPGYELAKVAVSRWRDSLLVIALSKTLLTLKEIEIEARSPISEQFSVRRLNKLDIYLSPQASGDALRAISVLPASSNVEESANPALRGSDAELTRVVVNGVPVYRPVRNGQLNGIGNFSLFNTELLSSMDIYASNPPLTYGNSSAGLVEIQMTRSQPQAGWQLSGSMASVGLFRDQPIGKRGFLQAYANHQFSGLFIGAHPRSLAFLNEFGNKDAGLHLYLPIGDHWTVQALSYGIDEFFSVNSESFTYAGEIDGNSQRFFQLLTVERQGQKGKFAFHGGADWRASQLRFGALNADRLVNQSYLSGSYKGYVSDKLSWQAGINLDTRSEQFQDRTPRLFYAFRPGDPAIEVDTMLKRPLAETHVYVKWDPNSSWHIAAGLRHNIPLAGQQPQLSGQLSARHDLNRHHSLLLSAGRYHSYLDPGNQVSTFSLIQSDQVSLDYQFTRQSTRATLAAFGKWERGWQAQGFLLVNQVEIQGLEASLNQTWGPYVELMLANTWLRQRVRFSPDGAAYPGLMDFPYFLKASVAFNHPDWFNANLTWIGRPGTRFTPVIGSQFEQDLGLFRPVFGETIHTDRFAAYSNLSFAMSRFFALPSGGLIVFLTINNLDNRQNQRERWYNADYESFRYDYFSLRTIYAGIVWRWQKS
ncbi:MAG: TonB-dependent receptor [Bacteroidia bacterium]|nr:TonB-dependent receptor [Bacteroidia bacterium]